MSLSHLLTLGPVYFFATIVILLIGVTLVTFGRFRLLSQLFEWQTSRRDDIYRLRENVSFVRPPSENRRKRTYDETISVTVVDYLRVGNDVTDGTKRYGVSTVDAARTMRMGYTRSLKRLRQSSIVVGDPSNETKCDLWMSTSDQTELIKQLKRCNVNDGSQACFHCAESRSFVRECVHMSRPLPLLNKENVSLVIPANSDVDEGWCLPSTFRDVTFVDDKPIPITSGTNQRNCNSNTGDWLLVRVTNSVSGSIDSAYNWICRCRYPSLMTNLYDLTTDCAKPVGCQPNGELDEDSRMGRVDPYSNGRCVCNDTHKSSFDKTIGPICVSRTILDYGFENLNAPGAVDYLPISAVSLEMLSLMVDVDVKNIKLPNPCHYDAFWKQKLTDAECQLIEYTSDGKRIAFCVSRSENYVAFCRRSDYLLNNHGKYPNACIYVGVRDILDEDKREFIQRPVSGHREYIDHVFMLSYYNGRILPDVGLIVYRNDRVQKLYDLVVGDQRFAKWYAHNCLEIDPSERSQLIFGLSKFFLTRPLVVYNVFPDVKSITAGDVRSLFTLYDLAVNPDERLQKLMTVSDQKNMKHIHPFNHYAKTKDVYLFLDSNDYNNYVPSKIPDSCVGYGVVDGEKPVYLEYFDQNADSRQMRKYGVQWFIRSADTEAMRFYPALPTTDICGISCEYGGISGRLKDAYETEYPKLWPVVVHGNRKFAPNVLHRHFDATVQIVATNNFYIVMTNGYSSDFLDYKNKNRYVFEARPKGFVDFS